MSQLSVIQAAMNDLDSNANATGLRLTIERTISFSDPSIRWGLRVERERLTASGRQGKPESIVLLVNNPDERPSHMLRMLADVLENDERSSSGELSMGGEG